MPRQFLDRHHYRQLAGPNTTVLSRKWHRQNILLRQQFLHIPGKLARMVNLRGAWCHPLQRQLANRLYQRLFVFSNMGYSHGNAPSSMLINEKYSLYWSISHALPLRITVLLVAYFTKKCIRNNW